MMRAEQDYGVEVIRPFLQFSPGFVMFPTTLYRDSLVRGGWVKPLTGPKQNADDKPSIEALRARKPARLTR